MKQSNLFAIVCTLILVFAALFFLTACNDNPVQPADTRSTCSQNVTVSWNNNGYNHFEGNADRVEAVDGEMRLYINGVDSFDFPLDSVISFQSLVQ